jgi:hypothetical protein
MRKFITLKHAWLYKFGCIAGLSSLLAASKVDAQTYCTPTYSFSCTSEDDINTITLTGANGTSINQPNTGCSTNNYIYYNTIPTVAVITGNTYSGTINSEYPSSEYVRIWIDFNNNGTFETTESIGTVSNFGTTTVPFSITIPSTALTGNNLRMRFRCVYGTTAATIDPCTSQSFGETHDYNVNVLPPAPPNNAGVTALVTPSSNQFCSNTTDPVSVLVSNLGSDTLTSANINWSVNGVLQTPLTLPVTLPNFHDTVTVVLGNVFFPDTNAIQLKAWTSMPNGVPDTNPADDTLTTNMQAEMMGVDVHITPQDTIICKGHTITLDAGANHPVNPIYIWNNGQISQTINVSDAGVYSVWVQNSVGCFGSDTITVGVHPEPVVNSIAIIDNEGGSYTINVIGAQNVVSYHWDFGDGNTQDGTGIPGQVIHQYADSGEYNVVLTLTNDCGSITVTRLISTTGPVTTGIDNVTGLQRSISIAPNPSKAATIIMASNDIKMKSIVVYNLLGQKVFALENVNASRYELNVSSLSNGMYNVIIDTDKGQTTKKLEVVR